MATTRWGEIPTEDDGFTPDVTGDIERSMSKFSLAMYKIEGGDESQAKTEEIILSALDPLVVYAVSLHKHIIDVDEMIRVSELAAELNLLPPEDAIPKIPPVPDIPVTHKPNNLNYIPKEFTPFSTGEKVDVPELSEAVVKQILSKSVAVLFAHIGYESTHQSIVDLMTDILEDFYKKICHKIRIAIDDEEKNRMTTFPHVIERVLTEIGMDGVKGLNDYYQNRVIKYVDVLLKRCKEVDTSYRKLLKQKSQAAHEIFSVKVKEEDALDDNPELHFASLEGELDYSSLQTGFQLLNSLEAEAEANFSLVEAEDVINVPPSPGVVSLQAESDNSHLSPFTSTKKKKFK